MKPKIYHFIPNLIEGGGVNYPLILSESINEYEHVIVYRKCSSTSLLQNITTRGYSAINIRGVIDFLKLIFPNRKNSIFHFHGYGNYRIFFLCRLISKANIIQPHGYFPSGGRKGLSRLVVKLIEKIINHLSLNIISISSGEKIQISALYRNSIDNKIITILTGMDVSKINYKNSIRVDKKIKFISLSARNIYQKGLDRLLVFSKILNDYGLNHEINVYFRGNNDKEFLIFINMLKNWKGHSVIHKNIIDDIWNNLEFIPDFLISLSRFEGLPLTVIEAGLRRIPIILTSNTPGHEEFSNINGVYEVDNRFLNEKENKNLFNEVIDFISKTQVSDSTEFAARFNFKKMIQDYKDLYEKCIYRHNHSC